MRKKKIKSKKQKEGARGNQKNCRYKTTTEIANKYTINSIEQNVD